MLVDSFVDIDDSGHCFLSPDKYYIEFLYLA